MKRIFVISHRFPIARHISQLVLFTFMVLAGKRWVEHISDDGSASGAQALDKISCDDKVPNCDRHRVTRADFAAVLPHFGICLDYTYRFHSRICCRKRPG